MILDKFFKLKEKATGGDPKRGADWNFYMMLFMFIMFLTLFVKNIITAISLIQVNWFDSLNNFAWAGVILVIIWFQFDAFKLMYEQKKFFNNPPKIEIEPEEEMLKEFEDKKNGTSKMSKM